MSDWTTRPGATPLKQVTVASPGLLFHKWQAWDARTVTNPKRTDSRLPFLERVADAIERVYRDGGLYKAWLARYRGALEALPGGPVTWIDRKTLWRLVIGMATNPALESGLSLHPLLGVPYLPGSALKGLTHQVAEWALAETLGYQMPDDPSEDPGEPSCPTDPKELNALLDAASRVRAIFGSLSLERARRDSPKGDGQPKQSTSWGPWTPKAILDWWSQGDVLESLGDEGRKIQKRMRDLLEPTGGAVAFYDALPVPESTARLVEPDVMTPHYPQYYDSKGGTPPSDDQDPRPVTFLTVAPEVTFGFAFRLRRTPLLDEVMSLDAARTQVGEWLTTGLVELGAGGKTAAGYGYFEDPTVANHVDVAPAGRGRDVPSTDPAVEPPGSKLPGDLGAGELATLLDEAMGSSSEEDQEEIARAALATYGRIIGKWKKDLRKGKGGEQRARRVEWLEKFDETRGGERAG